MEAILVEGQPCDQLGEKRVDDEWPCRFSIVGIGINEPWIWSCHTIEASVFAGGAPVFIYSNIRKI